MTRPIVSFSLSPFFCRGGGGGGLNANLLPNHLVKATSNNAFDNAAFDSLNLDVCKEWHFLSSLNKMFQCTTKAKAYRLSTCLSWNSRSHKCPEPQLKILNQDLDQLKYLSCSQAWQMQENSVVQVVQAAQKLSLSMLFYTWLDISEQEHTNQITWSKQFEPGHLYWQ